MIVAFSLSGSDRCIEFIVINRGVDDLVAMGFRVGWLNATRNRVPAVEEEDSHRANSPTTNATRLSLIRTTKPPLLGLLEMLAALIVSHAGRGIEPV